MPQGPIWIFANFAKYDSSCQSCGSTSLAIVTPSYKVFIEFTYMYSSLDQPRTHALFWAWVRGWHSEVSTCFQLRNWHDVILSSNLYFITKLQILTLSLTKKLIPTIKLTLRLTLHLKNLPTLTQKDENMNDKMSVWKMETSIYLPTCTAATPGRDMKTQRPFFANTFAG